MPETTTASVAILAVLVFLSACFSATETAFSCLNRTRLRALSEGGSCRARIALGLVDNYDKLLSTILIGNNIVNIAAASIGTVLFVRLCGNAAGPTVSTVVMTVVVLIFGEISPKSVAKDCPERFAMLFAPVLRALIWLLTPLNFLFTAWKRLLGRLLRLKPGEKMSQAELLMLVEEVEQEGTIDRNEGELLRNAIEFSEQEARDILTHRMVLEAVTDDAAHDEVAARFADTQYSRLLVCHEDIDHIVGVVHQKDFYAAPPETALAALVAPVLFVREGEKISALLRQLQKNKCHVAVVLDEYGGTCGIVTMEDILEELVGEIWDEHDEAIELISELSPGLFRVNAAMSLDDFCRRFALPGDSDMVSLSGWVAEQLGHVPEQGERFSCADGAVEVTVSAVDGRRAEEIIVRVRELAEENG